MIDNLYWWPHKGSCDDKYLTWVKLFEIIGVFQVTQQLEIGQFLLDFWIVTSLWSQDHMKEGSMRMDSPMYK